MAAFFGIAFEDPAAHEELDIRASSPNDLKKQDPAQLKATV